jgi:hypothetical protein
MCAEVKVRAHGFGQLYAWLDGREILIVRQDRCEPLVVLPLRLAAEIAGYAERSSRLRLSTGSAVDSAGPNAAESSGIVPSRGPHVRFGTFNTDLVTR